MSKKSAMVVLANHFNGDKADPSYIKLTEFGKEVKALDENEKNHLATLAAIEQGLTEDDVKFPWTPTQG